MALKLRRGTDAERQTITFEVGEPVYTTDTNLFYIGDGTTAGGNLIAGNLVQDASPQLGANLDLNGNNITGTGNINIDGTITATGNINLGDGVEDNVIVGGLIGSSLIADTDSTYNLGSQTSRWRNVFASGASVDGQIDAISINADLIGDDSTVAFDKNTGIFTGDLVGNVTGNITGYLDGDVEGSIFSDDSTIMLDGNNRILDVITAIADTVSTALLKVDNIVTEDSLNPIIKIQNPELSGNFTLEVDSTDGYSTIELAKVSAGDLTGDGGSYGKLNFTRRDINGTVITSQIWGGGSGGGIYLSSDSNGLPSGSGSAITATWEEGKLGLGTFTPQHTLDVRGEIVATNYVQFGSLTFTERDALTPAAGMVIWNSDSTQFEGYDGTNWINLVDGATSTAP